jgi:ATP-dependent Lon protease
MLKATFFDISNSDMSLTKEVFNMPEQINTIPLFLLDSTVPFPGCTYTIDAPAEDVEGTVKESFLRNKSIMLVNSKDSTKGITRDNIYTVGVCAVVLNAIKNQDGSVRIVVAAGERGILQTVERHSEYTLCQYEDAMEFSTAEDEEESRSVLELLQDSYAAIKKLMPLNNAHLTRDVEKAEDPGELSDILTNAIARDFNDKRHILDELDTYKRSLYAIRIMEKEADRAKVKNEIILKARELMDESQKEYFLREELRAINEELGDKSGVGEEVEEYRQKAKELNMPQYAIDKLEKEYDRLRRTMQGSQEGSIIRDYIDNVLSLPWGKMSTKKVSLKKAEEILDADHYGLTDVKEKILEFLAVKHMVNNPKAPILCLVGPPGVGKTSIAKSIAKACGREYVRMSLGGLNDENEIRGHRKTYLGAMPGRIISAIRQAGVSNPLLLLDEIDKLGRDYKGDPAAAFLEILDGEQNVNFRDNYIEMAYDLSKVFFVCTANSIDTIPVPLRDRLEIIELSSYTPNEKMHIAKDYLLPKQLKLCGLNKTKLKIKDDAIDEIISGYTREAGVRGLERTISTLCRKAVKRFLTEDMSQIVITSKNIGDYLGKKKFLPETINQTDEVGVCRGLAWTSVGGCTLSVEVNLLKGKGNYKITGNIGKVMEESYNAALSYIRANADELGITTDFDKTDVHIHIPEGATPKDGPSAGITMATAMVSAMTNKPVKADVAMTGEISIRGKVMPIGGLKEKVLAAKRAGVKKIIIPYENGPDLAEIPDYGREDIEFVLAHQMNEVLKNSIARM